MMAVDIDDREILVAPLLGLLRCMGEQGRGVEFLDREIAKRDVLERIHEAPPLAGREPVRDLFKSG